MLDINAGYAVEGASQVPDQLIVGTAMLVSRKFILLMGQNVERGTVIGQAVTGTVSAVAVTAGGSGYTSAPAVSFTGGGGTGAAATAAFAAGAVTTVTITAPGSGYATAPTVVFTGGAGTGAAATASVATGGKVLRSLAAASDGSQTPFCIAAETRDATLADKEILAYTSGRFNGVAIGALILGTGHTLASIREGLRGKGIVIDEKPVLA